MLDRDSCIQPPPESDFDRDVFLAAVRSGNIDRIRLASRRLMSRTASPSRTARFIRGTIQKNNGFELKRFRLALLSSFTIEIIDDHLFAHGCTEGLYVDIYQPGFDQYFQEILNPESGLYSFAPDAIVLAIDGIRWAPDLYDRFLSETQSGNDSLVDSTVSRITTLVTELRRRTNAVLMLHSLSYPRYPSLGILDINHSQGQRETILRINQGLADMARVLGGVYLIDMDALIQTIGHDKWYDPRLDFFARLPIGRSAIDGLARYYLRFLRALSGYSRKCVIVDLDNTLWGGILGEAGPKGIQLGSEYPGNAYVAFQRALLGLRNRGILLAIASKNNVHEVHDVFAGNGAMILTLEHFSAREIHWRPKSESVACIAKSLNLDPRHLVFIDDNPAECAEVEQAYPEVTVIALPKQPEGFINALLADGLFDTLAFSNEDMRRTELYEQREAAEELRTQSSSLDDYYRSLEMRVHLDSVNSGNVARAAQLTVKTNQFNATTKRYSEADIRVRCGNEMWIGLTMRVVDTFGDNGIVGLMLAERKDDVYEIDTFLLSCRVINRTAESVMLHWLASKARALGLVAIEGSIMPTDRNVPVRDLYQRHGFNVVKSSVEKTLWRLDLAEGNITLPSWFEIIDETTPQ
jgi:FkbH-like protein